MELVLYKSEDLKIGVPGLMIYYYFHHIYKMYRVRTGIFFFNNYKIIGLRYVVLKNAVALSINGFFVSLIRNYEGYSAGSGHSVSSNIP